MSLPRRCVAPLICALAIGHSPASAETPNAAKQIVAAVCGRDVRPTMVGLGTPSIWFDTYACPQEAPSGSFTTKLVLFNRPPAPATLAAVLEVPGRVAEQRGLLASLDGATLVSTVQEGVGGRLYLLTLQGGKPALAAVPGLPEAPFVLSTVYHVVWTADGRAYHVTSAGAEAVQLNDTAAIARTTLSAATVGRPIVYIGSVPIPLGAPRSDELVNAIQAVLPGNCAAGSPGGTTITCEHLVTYVSDGKSTTSTLAVNVVWAADTLSEVAIEENAQAGIGLSRSLLDQSVENTRAWWGAVLSRAPDGGEDEESPGDCGGSTEVRSANGHELLIRIDGCAEPASLGYRFTMIR